MPPRRDQPPGPGPTDPARDDSGDARYRHIEAEVLGLVRDETGREARPGDRLSVLGIDSLEVAHLVGVVEKRFHIEADAEILDVDTVEDLARYIESRSR